MWGRCREWSLVLVPLSAGVSHSLRYPQLNWAPLVLISKWVDLCILQAPVGLFKELSCEAGSFSCCCLNPYGCFQSVVWGFISPPWSPGLPGLLPGPPAAASLVSCSLACPNPQSAALLGPPATAFQWVLFARLPISTPPTWLDEGFLFISLVVGLPYSSIYPQFWLFFCF